MLNRLAVIGNVVADPVTGRKGETTYAIIRVAVNRQWKDAKGEKQEATDFLTFKSFKPAQVDKFIQPYVKKGCRIYIEGDVRTQKNPTTVIDAQGNSKSVNIESIYFQVDKIELIGTRRNGDDAEATPAKEASQQGAATPAAAPAAASFSDFNPNDFDDIPGPDGS